MKDEEPPFIDLHPSQWEHKEHSQPFFGEQGKMVLLMFLLAFPIGAAVMFLVTGRFPYWLDDYITVSWDGIGPLNALIVGVVAIAVLGVIEVVRSPRQ